MEIPQFDICTPDFTAALKLARKRERISEIIRIESKDILKDTFGAFPLIISRFPKNRNLWSELKNNFGDIVANVRIGDYASPENYLAHRKFEKVPINKFMNSAECGATNYAGNQAFSETLLDKLNMGLPSIFNKDEFLAPAVWVGGRGCVTPLHKDGSPNFAMHFYGKKKWILFDILDVPELRMSRPLENSDFAVSKIDLRECNQTPRNKTNIQPIEVIVNAGEMLYLPANWGHFVTTLENTIMANYWRPTQKDKLQSPPPKPWDYL